MVQSEKYLRGSGLDYTIVRPGGLKADPQSAVGNLILQNEDTLRAKKEDGGTAISRETVSSLSSSSSAFLCDLRQASIAIFYLLAARLI